MVKTVNKVPDDAVQIPNGLDFGFFPDPTAFCQMWVKKKGLRDELYIKEIAYNHKLSINSKGTSGNLTDLLLAKGVNPKHLTIAECADPGAIAELRDAKFNVEAVRKMSVEASIRLFHDYEIFIVGNSPNALKEFENYKYKRSKKGIILGVPEEGQADHIIDLVRYVLMSRNTRWSVK
jgi:phage terminase large subunit